MVAIHSMMSTAKLVCHSARTVSIWRRVRHFEHRCNTAENRRHAARFEVFLVLKTRLSKVHLRVDNTGQDV